MALGYDGKLYILAFDHRGSFQKKMFGIEGDPTPEQTADDRRRQAPDLRGHGGRREPRRRPERHRASSSTSSSAADDPAGQAKDRGLKLAMPVEKSGQNEFDFQYGEEFGEHIEKFDPDFSKVLVRYNPDGDAEMNDAPVRAPQARWPTGCTSTTASSSSSCWCPPRRPSSARSAATPTATTPSCGPS